jgi:hypothetical protein
MSRLTRAAVLPALAAIVLLAGCASPALPANAGDGGVVSHSPAPTAPAKIDLSKIDACTVLTQSESETLIGTKLTAPIRASNPDVSSCTYPGDPNGPTAQVEIYIGDGAKQQLAIDKDKLKHPFTQPTGLGDEAWQEDEMIWARTSSTWISIRVVSLDDASQFTTPLQTAMAEALKQL